MDELLGQLVGSVQLGLDQVKSLQALERLELLRRLAQLVAEVVGWALPYTSPTSGAGAPLATISSSPRLSCKVSSRCTRAGLSGRVASNASPFRRAASASG